MCVTELKVRWQISESKVNNELKNSIEFNGVLNVRGDRETRTINKTEF